MELLVLRGDTALVTLPLDADKLSIGRASTNDLAIPDPTVSRHQCVIQRREGRLWLKDSSGQGTQVGDKRYSELELHPGALIRFGQLSLRLSEGHTQESPATTLSGGKTDILDSNSRSEEELGLSMEGRPPIPLRQGLSLGADASNDLRVEDGAVSGFHCRFTRKDGGWFVQDLNSTNGTFVNEVRVGEARLEDGMRLRLGRLNLLIKAGKDESGPEEAGFCGIVSRDPSMEAVFELIRRAAPTDETVLVTGESGSGKELVAQALHRLSLRKNGAIVPLNCSAISKDLLESELFGHEKGAFTGAQSRRSGLFEQADGGSLFLDEIGELALDLQAKLLRVLENGEIRPVGSDRPRRVDVRMICATHRKLAERVREGEFREDLYYRICVIEIPIPPLRQRSDDIPLLAEHFLARATRHQGGARSFSPSAMARLKAYPFPGNVRELKHAVTRAAILCPDQEIGEEHLSFAPPTLADQVAESSLYRKGKTLRDVEIDAIRQALSAHDYNQKAAARSLGIARSTLHTKMERYDIPSEGPK